MRRPNPPDREIPGHVWRPIECGPDWKVHPGYPCRAGAGPGRPSCKKPSVLAMNRYRRRNDPPYGRTDSWWAYCAEHTFGRWVEDGRVMQWLPCPVETVHLPAEDVTR